MNDMIFIGKRTDNSDWVEGFLFNHYDSFYEEYRLHIQNSKTKVSFEVNPDTISRGTGRTDKNNKKIYEGHIIKATILYDYIGIVRFGEYAMSDSASKTHLGFYIEWVNNEIGRPDFIFWLNKYGKRIEIIGNIHDNPELVAERKAHE